MSEMKKEVEEFEIDIDLDSEPVTGNTVNMARLINQLLQKQAEMNLLILELPGEDEIQFIPITKFEDIHIYKGLDKLAELLGVPAEDIVEKDRTCTSYMLERSFLFRGTKFFQIYMSKEAANDSRN